MYLPCMDTLIAVLVLGSDTIFKVSICVSKVKVQQITSFRAVPKAEFHAHSKLKILYHMLDVQSHVIFALITL